MRIVVSGTHASGKSTLIADFAAVRPGYEVLPDPFEELEESALDLDAGTFYSQLVAAAGRLRGLRPGDRVIAERGPLDFLAYLRALDDLGRPTRSPGLLDRGATITAEAAAAVDLLVLLPLHHRDPIPVGDDEDPELRSAMDAALLDLADDPSLTGRGRIVELTGSREDRLARLLEA
ncbi:AAA family ATPase [Tsukamurella tyrosinosolvens]|uniref:AAA family ATPase n=1 Tax=Tsukamurella tyrosinosolvens TaxID=57704 RepID=UPI002DD44B79|nr:AAA family ATPase [Tsukamurella tyrosinosolvens]MEC4611979.1 AAA family ATPase [Tsukamurella tyrosinosolvens]